jgi:5'-nucleotidase
MRALVGLYLLVLAQLLGAADFTVTLLHVNDTHARVEPTMIAGKSYGGMARLGTLVERYRKSDPNVIFLHGGDAFQGTMFFNVYEGLADLAFFNAMKLDAMAVGNHEFDKGPAALGKFAQFAQFPVLATNLDVQSEPALEGRIGTSTVLTRGGQKIGIVGATTPQITNISNTGPNVHTRDLTASVQAEVDKLTRAGIDKIFLVTHVGYTGEQTLAKTIHGVDVIVGGHSHSYLGSAPGPGGAKPEGPYPTVVANADGGTTLLVQSWEGERVMGHIQVTFDSKGRVKKWRTDGPELLDESVPPSPVLQSLVETLQKPIAQQRDRKIAEAAIRLPQHPAMGEIIADAIKAATEKQGVQMALMNHGGVRASLEQGDITFGNAIAVQPFGNTLVLMELTGAEIQAALSEPTRPVYVSSGVTYSFDAGQPAGKRATEVAFNGQPLSPTATYRVCVNNFMADGGDGFATLKAAKDRREDTGLLDLDALLDYLMAHSPLRANDTAPRARPLTPIPEH